MAGYAYPFDSTGLASTNIVTGEVHNLANYTNAYRCIIPLYAPFYRDDLLVKHRDTGRVLVEGLDYYLGYYYKEMSDSARRGVYGGIFFADTTLVGSVEFTRYHTVGGQYLQRKKDLDDWLATEPMLDPRNVDFAAILKWPRVVEPFDEPTTMQEALGIDPVLRSLDAVYQRMVSLAAAEREQFGEIIEAMQAVTRKIVDYQFDGHYYGTDPHHNTFIQLKALGKNQTAANAIKAYGKTLAELIALINQMGITPTNVAQYYELIGGVFEGRMTFKNDSTCQIRNTDGSAYIDLTSNALTIQANGNIRQVSDSDKNESTMGALVEAGNNTLSVHSSATGHNVNHALWNGQVLIHAGNITQFVTTQQTNAVLELVVGSTTEVTLLGKGTPSNPLQAAVDYTEATTALAGLAKLSALTQSQSTDTVVSNEALADAAAEIAQFVPKTRTVNGKSLLGNVTITKGDLGLGNVNNTADADKPASTAFTTAVSGKAQLNHDHDWNDLTDVPAANNTTVGIAKMFNAAPTSSELSPLNLFLSNKTAAMFNVNQLTPLESYLNTTPQPLVEFPVIEWGKYTAAGRYTDTVYYASINGFELILLEFRVVAGTWDYSELGYDLSMFPWADGGTAANRTVYFYIDNGSGSLIVSETHDANDLLKTYIGTVKTNATAISSTSFQSVYRLLNVTELMQHIESTSAHGNLRYDKARYGLSNIENKPLVHAITLTSFADIYNTWYRFSHATTGVYPANATEVNSWSYDSTTDSIKCTVSSNTFIGFVSIAQYGDYEFDTRVSSTEADDDTIGVVIGFYKDPTTGKESTLSVVRNANLGSIHASATRVLFNGWQADQWVMYAGGVIPAASNWATVGSTRIRVFRSGDTYKIEVYGFTALEGDVLIDSVTIDLNSDSRLSVFKGTTRVGYCAQSQNNATFANIVRPDEDLRNQYASEQAVKDLVTNMESSISITTGVVADADQIPIPTGFTAAQCVFHVVPKTLGLSVNTAIEQLECFASAAGVVTCHAKLVADSTWVAGTATYYCIGRK